MCVYKPPMGFAILLCMGASQSPWELCKPPLYRGFTHVHISVFLLTTTWLSPRDLRQQLCKGHVVSTCHIFP